MTPRLPAHLRVPMWALVAVWSAGGADTCAQHARPVACAALSVLCITSVTLAFRTPHTGTQRLDPIGRAKATAATEAAAACCEMWWPTLGQCKEHQESNR